MIYKYIFLHQITARRPTYTLTMLEYFALNQGDQKFFVNLKSS